MVSSLDATASRPLQVQDQTDDQILEDEELS